MIGAFAGGLIGGFIGAGIRDPKVVVKTVDRYQEVDYNRLAFAVVELLKKERRERINGRIEELRKLEDERKFACSSCGKKIVCSDAEGKKFVTNIGIDFTFSCDCKKEKVHRDYARDNSWGTSDAHRIVVNNSRDQKGEWVYLGGWLVNKNAKEFKSVFDEAYSLWEKQSDVDQKNGQTPYTEEILRLESMLTDPFGVDFAGCRTINIEGGDNAVGQERR